MSPKPDNDGPGSALASGGIVLVPLLLCCGLPVLIAAGSLGVLGSILGNPWVTGAAAALLVGALVWRARRRTAASSEKSCSLPPPAADDETGWTQQPSTRDNG